MEDASPIAPGACTIYRCPGESYAIDHSVHVARLAAFYPPCLACVHRHDTAGLTPRQLRLRDEIERRAGNGLQWNAEGLFGSRPGDVTVGVVEQFATALSAAVWKEQARSSEPVVLVGSDGNWTTADFVPATCRPLELAGCRAVEIGAVTTAALAFEAARGRAAAAIWIGNASGEPHAMAIKAWHAGGQPSSSPGVLDAVRQFYESPPPRSKRRGGTRGRLSADVHYLPTLARAYHGLRPLVFVLDTTSEALVRYWQTLAADAACRVIRAARASDFRRKGRRTAAICQEAAEGDRRTGRA